MSDWCEEGIQVGRAVRQCALHLNHACAHAATFDANSAADDRSVTAVIEWPAADIPPTSPRTRVLDVR